MENNETDKVNTWINKASNDVLDATHTNYMSVEIFKTNVQSDLEAKKLISDLNQVFPVYKINFDLDDCDKILRVAGEMIEPGLLSDFLIAKGYFCQLMN